MTFETDIQSVLKDLSSKDWNVRFRSLEKLQVLVQDNVDNTGVWTKEVLISLHKPLMTQLKDLRSSIVREVGKSLVALSQVLGNAYSVLGRYLVETQLHVIGAGNKVITDYVDESLQAILQNSHIKGAIQVIEKTGAASKSSIVREKCYLYMALVLENWDINALRKHESTIRECIKHGIADAGGKARQQARRCFVAFAPIFPEVADKLLKYCDHRTQKTLRTLVAKSNAGAAGVPKTKRPAAIKTGKRKSSRSSSPSSSAGSSPRGTTPQRAAGNMPEKLGSQVLGGSSLYEVNEGSSGSGSSSSASPKKSTGYNYESISPRFHGVQVDQNDLIAGGVSQSPTHAGDLGATGDEEATFLIGDRVWVEADEGTAPATVRFTGHTEFAIGMWIGLELDGFDGRNDGSVQGIRYFSCEAGKGLFKRPTAVAAMTPEEILSNKPPSLAQPATKALQGRSNTGKSGAVQPKSVGSKDQVPVAHQLGCQILAVHRCHIDDVLATLRAEMEELAEFETNSAVFDQEFVQNYVAAVKRRVQQRISLQKQIVQDIADFEHQLSRAAD